MLVCPFARRPMDRIIEKEKIVSIAYTNWRGETAQRIIIPDSIYFGSTQWHPEPQWLLRALDVEKQAMRDFAMKDICSWEKAL